MKVNNISHEHENHEIGLLQITVSCFFASVSSTEYDKHPYLISTFSVFCYLIGIWLYICIIYKYIFSLDFFLALWFVNYIF